MTHLHFLSFLGRKIDQKCSNLSVQILGFTQTNSFAEIKLHPEKIIISTIIESIRYANTTIIFRKWFARNTKSNRTAFTQHNLAALLIMICHLRIHFQEI